MSGGLRSKAALLGPTTLLAVSACTGLIQGDIESIPPEELAARAAFIDKALPVFETACKSCHAGSVAGEGFLAGANPLEIRDTLLHFDPQLVNLEQPQSSRVLAKGPHAGPELQASQASDILEWISAERDAAGATGGLDPGLETPRFKPQICTGGIPGDATCPINYIDLTPLIQGWAGAKIKMVAQELSLDLYVTNLALEGGPDGVYLEHPFFASWPAQGEPIPDLLDRFFNVKINMMAGATPQPIGGGTAAFIGFSPGNEITIHFKVIDRYRPDTGGPGTMTQTGCRELTSFIANAKPQMQTNCASCHANAGNAGARGAMDITGIAATDTATLQGVCNQARTRINFNDTNASGFFIAPNPAMATNHPFKFPAQVNFDTFKAAMDIWVQAEKIAQ